MSSPPSGFRCARFVPRVHSLSVPSSRVRTCVPRGQPKPVCNRALADGARLGGFERTDAWLPVRRGRAGLGGAGKLAWRAGASAFSPVNRRPSSTPPGARASASRTRPHSHGERPVARVPSRTAARPRQRADRKCSLLSFFSPVGFFSLWFCFWP